jgi:hypothetical protein
MVNFILSREDELYGATKKGCMKLETASYTAFMRALDSHGMMKIIYATIPLRFHVAIMYNVMQTLD